jgi:hypothetical protein
MEPQELSGLVSEMATPFIAMMIGIVVSLWIKDFAVAIAKGMNFKFFGPFKEGDKAMLDGKMVIVVKIGLTQTVFGIKGKDELGGKNYIWRYVPNEKISGLKLGKVIMNDNKL